MPLDEVTTKILTGFIAWICSKGIGIAIRPWMIERDGMARAEAKRHEMLVIAQTKRDIDEIENGTKRLTLHRTVAPVFNADRPSHDSLLNPTSDGLAGELARRRTARDLKEEVNVSMAVSYAIDSIYEKQGAEPDKQVDEDWIYRWRSFAAQTSSEAIQQLWGRVLAGEYQQPGKFSLRALDLIKNLTKNDAKLIDFIGPYVIRDFVFKSQYEHPFEEIEANPFPNFHVLHSLEELGILASVSSGGLNFKLQRTEGDDVEDVLRCGEVGVLVSGEMDGYTPHDDFSAYPVTAIGRQILSLGTYKCNREYLERFAEYLRGRELQVELFDYEKAMSEADEDEEEAE